MMTLELAFMYTFGFLSTVSTVFSMLAAYILFGIYKNSGTKGVKQMIGYIAGDYAKREIRIGQYKRSIIWNSSRFIICCLLWAFTIYSYFGTLISLLFVVFNFFWIPYYLYKEKLIKDYLEHPYLLRKKWDGEDIYDSIIKLVDLHL
jgi:hypothetical protein